MTTTGPFVHIHTECTYTNTNTVAISSYSQLVARQVNYIDHLIPVIFFSLEKGDVV